MHSSRPWLAFPPTVELQSRRRRATGRESKAPSEAGGWGPATEQSAFNRGYGTFGGRSNRRGNPRFTPQRLDSGP